MKVISESLRFIADKAIDKLSDQVGKVVKTKIRWVLTVPALWSEEHKFFMRKAAQAAGIVEDSNRAAQLAHQCGALLIYVFAEAVSLGLLEPPREADIVAGELQSFAISPSYGGPFAGVIACKEKYMRQIPGRLVGETKDASGNRAFCLTLSAREQHIRREKATSNICTNQALIALMATVYLSVFGKEGLRELAEQNLAKSHYLAASLPRRFSGPFFNEFAAKGSCGDNGVPLGRFYPELAGTTLVCCTEMTKREDMDGLAAKWEASA